MQKQSENWPGVQYPLKALQGGQTYYGMYNYYKMLSSEDRIGEQWEASIYSVLKKCF